MVEVNIPAGENASAPVDTNASGVNAPGAGETITLMERPEWVPEKFYKNGVVNFRDMAKSFSELETKLGSQSQQKQPDGQQNQVVEPTPEQKSAQGEANKQFTIPGVAKSTLDSYTAEIVKDGKLSDKSYTDLAALGYNKAMVDSYVKGLTVDQTVTAAVASALIADKEIAEITATIGGETARNAMIQWASVNLSSEDLAAYNEAVSSKDVARVKQGVFALAKVYAESNEPSLLGGRNGEPSTGPTPFKSNEEVVRAMQDRRYENDPAYRDEIARRISVSDVFGQSRDTKDPEKKFTRYQS